MRACYAICLTFLIAGCAHTYSIGPYAKNPDIPPADVHPRLLNYDVTITLLNGGNSVGTDVIVGSDSTYYSDIPTHNRIALSNKDIHKLTITRHGRGFFEGLLLGIPTAAAVAFISLSGSGKIETLGDGYGFELAGAALIAFPIVCAIVGSKESYVINPK